MRILIVDDEPYTREGLRELIAQSALAFDEIATAPSGEVALEAIYEAPPDVLLCDVRMMGISGLDLARAVRTLYPSCRIVLMSGYRDREYLKTALDLQAVAFIDKPIEERELLAALAQAIGALRASSEDGEAARVLKGEEIARALLRAGAVDPAALGELIGDTRKMVCRGALIQPAQLQRTQLLKSLDDLGLRGIAATDGSGNDALFVWHKPGNTLRSLCALLIERDAATRIAVGHVVNHPLALPKSYKSAYRALSTLFYRPAMRIAYAAGDAPAALSLLPPAAEFERALHADPQQALAHLESLHNALLEAPNTPPDLVRTHYHTLLGIALQNHGALVEQLLEEAGKESLWDACMGAPSLKELEALAWKALDHIGQMRKQQAETPAYAVIAARKYIHRHYHHESLQLKDVADDVHMSPGHLSTLFKRATGYTLRQYITYCRIEEARRLLKETNERNQDIARQVGYGDAYYFGQVFRRETGMSPQQFRKSG